MAGLLRRIHRQERGGALIESLVAAALLGIALVYLVGSLSTLTIASRQSEQVAVGQSLARAQATRIKAAPYQADGDYSSVLEPVPAGLSRTVTTHWWDGSGDWTATQNASGLQRVTVSVDAGGSTVASLELVKADR